MATGDALPRDDPLADEPTPPRRPGADLTARPRRGRSGSGRLGVTHSVWDEPVIVRRAAAGRGPSPTPPSTPSLTAPSASRRSGSGGSSATPTRSRRPARRCVNGSPPTGRRLFAYLTRNEARDEAWFYPADVPPPHADASRPLGPGRRLGRPRGGRGARRGVRPGPDPRLRPRLAGTGRRRPRGPGHPRDGGLQAIRIEGAGRTRVSVRFEPRALRASAAVSAVAASAALSGRRVDTRPTHPAARGIALELPGKPVGSRGASR